MNYETVSQAMLGSNRCLSGKDAGEFVTCDPLVVESVGGEGTHDILKKCTGYQDPMLYMNESLLPNDLDRLRWRTYAQKNPVEAASVFYTMDENNFLHTAREAILSAYTKIFEFSPETSKILLNSAPSSIEYYGGYRNYALNIYGDDAYGFNIVGKTLELLRAVLLKKKNVPGGKKMMMTAVQKGFQQFETPEMIGLLLLTITVCWNRLITGVDDLRVFFGKSVFEIVMMLGLQYSSNVLFSLYHRYESGLLLRELPHLDKTVLQNLVEQELMYPGNLVGFLRKHGFHHYYLAVRQNVYRTLWMSVGRRLMKNRYNHIPEDKWSLFLSENTRPELLEEKGPSLVQAFLRGKIEVEDVQMTQKIEFLHQPNLHQDALYFVPRVYSLHSTNASLKLFDYIDYEDALDRLSPSYVWNKKKGGGYNLVMEHGLEFPTVLHYIYFKTTAVYFPQDTASLQSLYKRIMFSSSPDTFVEVLNDTMKQRFEETVHQRRRELLREGIVKRIESNPVLMMPVTYFGIENNIHLDNDKLFTKLLPDDHAVVLTLCDERENIFPELDTVFTRFHQAEHSSIHMTTQETQLVFRVWTALYTKLLTWVQFVDSVIKKPVEAGWIELFFRVFQPETEKFRTVAQMVEVLSGIDPHAVDLKHHSDYISESMVAYFISHTTNPIAKIMKKLSKTWGAYISYNIRALVALREWTEFAKRGTPDIEKYLPHIPKLFLCSGVDSDEDSGGDKSMNNDVVGGGGGNGEEEKRIRDVMKKMSGILKPVWEWAKERKVWDDHFMLYLAWDLSKKHKGEVRYTGLQPLHSYISLPERVKVQKKMITTDPITGDVKTENVPVFEVRNVKTKVPLGFSSSISRALFDTYFSFLDGGEDSDHSATEKKSIEKTKIQLSYILRDILRDILR